MMEAAYPSLTSIRTPRYEIGQRAVQMARAALSGQRPEQTRIDVGFELKIRTSTMRNA